MVMKQFIHKTVFILLSHIIFFCFSCSNYPVVEFTDRDMIYSSRDRGGNTEAYIRKSRHSFAERYMLYPGEDKSYPVNRTGGMEIVLKRFFRRDCFSSPVGAINNQGVDCALDGRYRAAAVLFGEAIKEDDRYSPAWNNLGIMYEFFMEGDAHAMYSRACLLDPDNEYYRRNYLYFREKEHLFD